MVRQRDGASLPAAPSADVRRRIGLAALLVACGAVYAYWGVYLPLSVNVTGYDFTGPYEAAYALARHVPLPIYDVPQQRHFNETVLHLPRGPSDFRWTPQMAALLVPLGLLPYGVAHVVWFLISQGALGASLFLLAQCLSRTTDCAMDSAGAAIFTRLRSPAFALGVLFCASALSQPVTDSLRLGQSTPLLLLGCALAVYGEVFERPVLAGCGLGLAILVKLFPAALFVYYLWRGRYRLCMAALAFMLALTILMLPVTGVRLYGDFFWAVTTYKEQTNAGPVNLSLFHGLIVVLSALLRPGRPEPSHGVLVDLALAVCVLLFGVTLALQGWPDVITRIRGRGEAPAVLSRAHRHAGGDPARATMLSSGLAICAALLVEPIDWVFYYLLLLIPLAALLACADRWDRLIARRTWYLGLAGYVIATCPLTLNSRVAPPMSAAYVVDIALRPAALVVLWCVLALRLWGLRHVPGAEPAFSDGRGTHRPDRVPRVVRAIDRKLKANADRST